MSEDSDEAPFLFYIIIFYFLSCKLGRNTEKVVPSPSF